MFSLHVFHRGLMTSVHMEEMMEARYKSNQKNCQANSRFLQTAQYKSQINAAYQAANKSSATLSSQDLRFSQ